MINSKEEIILKGIPAAPGISISNICFANEKSDSKTTKKSKALTYSELSEKLKFKYKNLSEDTSAEHSSILDTYIQILSDPILEKDIKDEFENSNSLNSSISTVFDKNISLLAKSDNPYLKERTQDLEAIKSELLNCLTGKDNYSDNIRDIVYFDKISAIDVYNIKDKSIKGIISRAGGLTSHASIMARAFAIPYVSGVELNSFDIKNGTKCCIDGFNGNVVLNPLTKTISEFAEKSKKLNLNVSSDLYNEQCITKDGDTIELHINADFEEQIHQYKNFNPDGIGLVRTENLLAIDKSVIEYEKQIEIYSRLSQAAYPLDITIRLFDFGSDKYPEIINKKEDNPALGSRGIRFLLSEHKNAQKSSILSNQLKAILASSSLKNIKILIPFVIKPSEIIVVRKHIDTLTLELNSNDIDKNIRVGTMIETPAAAIIADRLAEVSDFFSIGSNDLAQYTLAADRHNPDLTDYYQWLSPSLLKLIVTVIDSANASKTPVSICGEVASNPNAVPLLLWAGINSFSVSPAYFEKVKKAIMKYCKSDFDSLIESLIAKTDDIDMLMIIEEFVESKNSK